MDIFCKIKSKKCQFILSFISAVIYQLGFAIIMESCNFTVYFLSYIHYVQEWVNMNYGNLMRPVVLLFLAIFSPLSGPMEHFCGPRLSILISSIIVEIAFVLLYFQRNIWFFYSLTLLLGIGNGLSTNILVKNSCFYFPAKKGLISSLIASIGSLFGSSYSFLGEKIINPERKNITNPQKEPYYALDIAERSKLFILFAIFLIPTTIIFTIVLLYKYDPDCEIEKETDKKVEEIKGPLLKETSEETNEANQNNTNEKKPKGNISHSFSKPTHNENIKKALKKWRFWRNILIVGAMPFVIWFEGATSRPYSAMIGVKGEIIGILAGSMNILGCLTNPIWAFCVDKFGFRPIMIVISSLTILLSIYFCIFMENPFFYVIGLYISTVLRGGIISSLIPHLMQIFGLRYFLVLGGLGRLFTQIFSFGAAAVSIGISIFKKTPQELLMPYRIVNLVGTGFAIFGLILVFFENDEKFNFEDEENQENEEKEGNENNGSPEDDDKEKGLTKENNEANEPTEGNEPNGPTEANEANENNENNEDNEANEE